jgi:chromosome partitioning protein
VEHIGETVIILFGGEKGGTGKSTLATNLSVWLSRKKSDFVLVDADRQSTSSNWVSGRGSRLPDLQKINCIQRYGNIASTVQDLASRYEHVIIDAAGRDSEELRSSLVVADVLFSPLKASQSDLWTVEHLHELVKLSKAMNSKLRAFAVLSMASPNPRVSEAGQAKEMLVEYPEIDLVKAIIRDRKVYRDAMCESKGVLEMNDERAREEIEALAKEVF